MAITDQTQRASAVNGDEFPYDWNRVCYMELSEDGELRQLRYKDDLRQAVERARQGSQIYAVWPGQYRSDLFLIDDLDALATARKL